MKETKYALVVDDYAEHIKAKEDFVKKVFSNRKKQNKDKYNIETIAITDLNNKTAKNYIQNLVERENIETQFIKSLMDMNLTGTSCTDIALDLARKYKDDIYFLLTDIQLGDGRMTSGIYLTEEIRKLKEIPIVGMTGCTDGKICKRIDEESERIGLHVFKKPLDLKEFLPYVDKLLDEFYK